MEQKDCQTARLRRKIMLQERLHTRSNKHSCKFVTCHCTHIKRYNFVIVDMRSQGGMLLEDLLKI